MASISSDDCPSDHHSGSYSPSADISESESNSSTTFSSRRRFTASSLAVAAEKSARDAALFWEPRLDKRQPDFSEVEMMKERFAKLLLGEDMSGGGKGVCTALAVSNAITNLSATVFGELWRLEPLASQKKVMWRREMDWLLSVSDSIVELVPQVQSFPGGGTFEVMAPRPRNDLHVNLPALEKLDGMLIGILDGFQETEFWYVDRGVSMSEDGSGSCPSSSVSRLSMRQEEKWWLPYPQVPPKGLSEGARRKLQQCRDCACQILKAAMAINSVVLAEMEIPDVYLESLPKNGKDCLGEIIYRYVTADKFSPDCLLDCLDLSSEYHSLEIVNRVEAAIYVWRLKGQKHYSPGKPKKSLWSGKVKGLVGDSGKNELLALRAESLLQSLRHRYPNLPQTVLDMNKIQYNKDVGKAILESYSRVMESLAFNIMARIDDLIFVDDATKKCIAAETVTILNRSGQGRLPIQKRISPSPFSIQNTPYASPFATPFCSTTPVIGSPQRLQPSLAKDNRRDNGSKLIAGELDKTWSYAGNLSQRKDAGDAPERD